MMKLAALGLVLSMGGCRQHTTSSQVLFYSPEDDEAGAQHWCRFEAPIIVAGRMALVSYRPEPHSKGAYGTPLHSIQIEIDVEEVLKGTLGSNRISASGFVMRAPGPLQRNGNLHAVDYRVGERRIVFLRKQGDVLRLARDNYDYTIRLFTGIHDPPISPIANPRARAAYLLLIPGAECNIPMWTTGFHQNLGIAALLIKPRTVDEMINANKVSLLRYGNSADLKQELMSFRESLPPLERSLRFESAKYPCLDFGQAIRVENTPNHEP